MPGRPVLAKLVAPVYWSRWRVERDGAVLGTIEKRGGFALWTALDADGRHVGSMLRTRADAIARLTQGRS